MNKLLKIFSIIIAIFVVFQYSIISNAADEQEEKKTEIILKTNDTEFESGKEIKVYIYMKSVKFEDGIAYIEGNIEYDSDILEPITTNDTTYNGWTTIWNTENGKIAIDRGNLTSTEQEVAELTFKFKTNTSGTEINFTNIKVMNDFEEDDVEDATLQLGESSTNNGSNEDENNGDENNNTPSSNENDSNDNDSDNNNDSNNSDEEQETKKDSEVDNSILESSSKQQSNIGATTPVNSQIINSIIPKTGLSGWTIIAIFIVSISGVISYKKYKKYKNV